MHTLAQLHQFVAAAAGTRIYLPSALLALVLLTAGPAGVGKKSLNSNQTHLLRHKFFKLGWVRYQSGRWYATDALAPALAVAKPSQPMAQSLLRALRGMQKTGLISVQVGILAALVQAGAEGMPRRRPQVHPSHQRHPVLTPPYPHHRHENHCQRHPTDLSPSRSRPAQRRVSRHQTQRQHFLHGFGPQKLRLFGPACLERQQ